MSFPVGGSQMNKFEQISSDHHQMSLAGQWAVLGLGPGGLRCDVLGGPMSTVQMGGGGARVGGPVR